MECDFTTSQLILSMGEPAMSTEQGLLIMAGSQCRIVFRLDKPAVGLEQGLLVIVGSRCCVTDGLRKFILDSMVTTARLLNLRLEGHLLLLEPLCVVLEGTRLLL